MDFLNQLATKNGLLGLLLAISLLAIWFLLKLLLNEKDKRLEDAKAVTTGITTPMAYIKDSLDLIQSKIKISKGE